MVNHFIIGIHYHSGLDCEIDCSLFHYAKILTNYLGYKHVVRVAEWSKAPDSSSGPRKRAWVQIPLLTKYYFYIYIKIFGLIIYLIQSKSNHVKLNAYRPPKP
ncbi:hypothetical protein LINPERPRIM_LOCUS12493 [Linum perenne]